MKTILIVAFASAIGFISPTPNIAQNNDSEPIDWDNITPRIVEEFPEIAQNNLKSTIDWRNVIAENLASGGGFERIVGGEEPEFVSPNEVENNAVFQQIQNIIGNFFDSRKMSKRDVERENQRIVNGEEVTPHSIPYQAGLRISTTAGEFFCGGSLISVNYVLTAAHCLDGAYSVEVILGAHKIKVVETNQQRITSTTFKMHEKYNSKTIEYDIGIVKLPCPAKLNDDVKIISLTPLINLIWFKEATVSGWGLTSSAASGISDVLRKADVFILPGLTCTLLYMGKSDIFRNVCTIGFGKESSCNGDSGGPLVVGNHLVGIVSFGKKYCDLGFPAVFTKVAYHLKWISDNSDL